MSVRNLRLREDTAKYLFNLDTDSAYYDPKTRSMRENPRPDLGPDAAFKGDAAWRASGAVAEIAAAQVRSVRGCGAELRGVTVCGAVWVRTEVAGECVRAVPHATPSPAQSRITDT